MPISGDPEKVSREAVSGELAKAKDIVLEAREAAEKLVKDAYESSLKEAERKLREGLARADEQLKSLLSVLDLELKSKLSSEKNKYIDSVLLEAKKRIREEKKNADWYQSYMEKVIRAVASEAEGEMLVKVAEEDKDLAKQLIKKFGGKKLRLSSEYASIIGGVIAESPDGSTRLDYSLDLLFKMEDYRLRSAASRALFKE